jgi:hypothetical protein
MADTSSFIGEIGSLQNIGQLIEEHNPPDGLMGTLSGQVFRADSPSRQEPLMSAIKH